MNKKKKKTASYFFFSNNNYLRLELLVNEKEQIIETMNNKIFEYNEKFVGNMTLEASNNRRSVAIHENLKQMEIEMEVLKAEISRKDGTISGLREKVENLEEKAIFRESEVKRETARKFEDQLGEISKKAEKYRIKKKELKDIVFKAQNTFKERENDIVSSARNAAKQEMEIEFSNRLRKKEEEIKHDLQKIVLQYESTIEDLKGKYTASLSQTGKGKFTNQISKKIS
jgi:hypothetical protein